jgi:amino acid adenylation domain-containing protein
MHNVLDYLENTAKRFPDKVGFIDKQGEETFASLRHKSLSVSSGITQQFGQINKPVLILLPKSVTAVAAFMGVLYSGNIYVPLDVKNPLERLLSVTNNLQPLCVITDNANYNTAKKLVPESQIIVFENIKAGVMTNHHKIISQDPVYIMNTSGSTGIPKGVVVSHSAVIDYVEWLKSIIPFNEKFVLASQAPFYFDNSVLDIYTTLACGGTLVIPPEEYFSFPANLLRHLIQHQVNYIFWVPSLLVNIANKQLLDSSLPELRYITFCGEVMPVKQLNYWRKKYPEAMVVNMYGPTEITDVCSYYIVDRDFDDNESLPIGKACENMDIFLLDEKNQLITQAGISGELCVRGLGLAHGYYNDFERTSKVFAQNPLNNKYPEKIYRTGDMVKYNSLGELIYEGRIDLQIKHMGHRIELGEIETALGTVSEIDSCCVVYNSVKSEITLYYAAETEINAAALFLRLQKELPKYMIPTALNKIDHLPQNANGKVDRKLLKAMAENA